MCDLVGFGVAIATGGQFVLNFPERTYKSMLIPLMQEDKRAGKSSKDIRVGEILKLRRQKLVYIQMHGASTLIRVL